MVNMLTVKMIVKMAVMMVQRRIAANPDDGDTDGEKAVDWNFKKIIICGNDIDDNFLQF